MSAYNLRLKKDITGGIIWQRRQSFENDRKTRIFDGKERLLGLNVPKLRQQQTDNELQRAKYEDLEMRYNQLGKDIQNAEYAQCSLLQQQALANEASHNYHRCKYQGKASRREWDLSDPKNYKHGIDYASVGASSAQIYEGNDAEKDKRKLQQKEQLRTWLAQQMEERIRSEKERKELNKAYDELSQKRDKILADMATTQHEARQANVADVHSCNVTMAKERRSQRERAKMQEREADKAEIQNTLNGSLLSEKPQNRVDPISKRGLTEQELAEFREHQKSQFQSLCQRKIEESMMHKQWEQYFYTMEHQLCMQDRQMDKLAQSKKDYFKLFNKKMIDESRERNNNLYNDNQPFNMEPFYDWFNRTSR